MWHRVDTGVPSRYQDGDECVPVVVPQLAGVRSFIHFVIQVQLLHRLLRVHAERVRLGTDDLCLCPGLSILAAT